jgi:hypothetical protein
MRQRTSRRNRFTTRDDYELPQELRDMLEPGARVTPATVGHLDDAQETKLRGRGKRTREGEHDAQHP